MVNIEDKKISPNKKVVDATKVQVLYMPLVTKTGYIYKPIVKAGDHVCIGTTLAKNNITDIPLLSSVSGTVVGFQEKYISNGQLVKCIVIENDFKERYQNKEGKRKIISKCSKEEFLYTLKKSGITGLGGGDFPTYVKYDTNKKIKYLIINAAECEIFTSCDGALIYNHSEEILECIDAILEIMNIEKAYIAINQNNIKVINKLLKHIYSYPNIKIYGLIDAYPTGYEKYLVNEILGLDYEKIPLEVGVIVNNVATIYAIYETLKYGKPLTDRIVSVSGPGIKNSTNYFVKIGTNFNELMMKNNEYKKIDNPILIAGGAMMGSSIPEDELIITRDLNTILVLDNKNETVEECIKCGKCNEVCPIGLLPSMIINNPHQAKDYKIEKCLNCGLCSYVCPSKIEVREILKNIKKESKNDKV